MSRLIGLVCTAILMLLVATPQGVKFSKYRTVEAYEIRPGVLMMPRYSEDGHVCEIGLEKRHYSPQEINLNSILSRKEIDQIFDELVPPDERGPKSSDFGADLTVQGGGSITTNIGYENVSLRIFSEQLPSSSRREIVINDIVATIHWKNRKCQ